MLGTRSIPGPWPLKTALFTLPIVWLAACGAEPSASADPDELPMSAACEAPGRGAPETISEALALLDALPSPVSVACVIESLDRPLRVVATRGTVSAQPAASEASPRIFVLSGHLTMSIVPDGRGREVLEFGESDGAGQSVKGELFMPVETPVAPGKPFDHLRYNEHVTVCGLCHRDERLHPAAHHPNAYISVAFRPLPRELVTLPHLRAEADACDPSTEAERCEILSAVFDHGEVEAASFPDTYDTIVRP